MGFWRKLFGIEERSAGSNDTSGVLEGGAELLRALIDGDKFTAEQALEIPAFSAAVDFISGTVSMLPVKLYRENTADSSTEEITDDRRLFLLNDEANPIMGADNAKRAMIRDMLLYGSGFLYVDQSLFGEVRSLRYVKKSDVSVMSNADPIFKDFNLFVGSRGYFPWNFVILTRNTTDGVTGTGTVDEHKTLLSAMYFMMKFERALSKTGGNKKGFLESEHKLSKEAMAEVKRLWIELYANNESNMMILNNGLKYVPSASSSVEMQLNENKLTNSDLTTLIFGLSSTVLSGRCTTQEYMSAIRTAVLPIVAQFQAALNRALLREDEKGEKYFALDTTELLKGDTLSRYQAYEIALRNNFLQLDEVRYLEDKKPIGFDFLKLGLNDVLYDAKTNTIYTPNMNALQKLGDQSLTQEEMRAIMEYRKKTNWIKGSHGYFAGSYPDGGGGGNLGLTNEKERDIMGVGSDKVTISSIDSPIEQKHTGKGNPNAVLIFNVELNNRQQELLNALPEYDSRVTVPKASVNMPDLSALTAKTGDEFAMFTKGGERLVIRGKPYKVNISPKEAKALAAQGYRWSGHTHPGESPLCLVPSDGDHDVLKAFGQGTSVIYNSKGQFSTFDNEE